LAIHDGSNIEGARDKLEPGWYNLAGDHLLVALHSQRQKGTDKRIVISKEAGVKQQPLLKWPGGKRALLNHLLPLVPSSLNSYFEPFLGGGALFFALQPRRGVLADNNPELVNLYLQVRDNPEELIEHLSRLRNTERDYYAIRSSVPEHPVERAARIMYLTTLAFNGIHRLNLRGQFNVPYGYKMHLNPCEPSKIRSASEALSSLNIMCDDFEAAVQDAERGDVVYLDPPYTVALGNNGFLKYHARIFSWDDQVRLSAVARNLVDRGCKVIVSNANHPSIVDLYEGFHMKVVERASRIAASGQFRRRVTECIFYNEV
jgi:DNA adenine methylase